MRWTLLACLAIAATGCDEGVDLRARMAAAGVFSPGRTDAGRQRVTGLGQLLFFEKELSGNRNVACSSCHMPFSHAADALPLGRGQGASGAGALRTGGVALPRNTPSPFNRSFAHVLLWDGRVERLDDGTIRAPVALPDGVDTLLEAQALLPLLDRDEMRGHAGDADVHGQPNELATLPDEDPQAIWDAVMARLMAIDRYRLLFAGAFPGVPEGEHTIVHVVEAIVRFEMRLWELTDTPFDQLLGAEHRPAVDTALSDTQRRGAELFFGDAGCHRCHDGPLLSDDRFHNIGVPPFGPGIDGAPDEGRFRVTGDPADRFAFRTPPLRNVELTGPYMHDGVFEWLEDAIRHHLDPDRALDEGVQRRDGVEVVVDPAVAAQIRETLDPDVRPLRVLSDDEVSAIADFLVSLTSQTERNVFPGAGEPPEVPSGLPVDRSL